MLYSWFCWFLANETMAVIIGKSVCVALNVYVYLHSRGCDLFMLFLCEYDDGVNHRACIRTPLLLCLHVLCLLTKGVPRGVCVNTHVCWVCFHRVCFHRVVDGCFRSLHCVVGCRSVRTQWRQTPVAAAGILIWVMSFALCTLRLSVSHCVMWPWTNVPHA